MTNLLPLELWRRIMGFNPWHFNGLADASIVPVLDACNDVVAQYDWQQAQEAGRESVIYAIENAEKQMAGLLGYAVAPHWGSETQRYPRFYNTGLSRAAPVDATGRWLSVTLGEGKVQELGIQRLSAIQNNNVLTFSDADGDGLNDTWTLTTTGTTTETDPTQIAVYFSAADRWDGSGIGDQWQVRPVRVTFNANGTLTITGRSWLVVRPVLYEGVPTDGAFPAIDPTVAAKFATTLDVWRQSTFADGTGPDTSQAEIIWETEPYPSFAVCCGGGTAPSLFDGSTDPASYWAAVARAGIRSARDGIIIPGVAVYDATTGKWNSTAWGLCRPPDRVTIRYYAGDDYERNTYAADYGQMKREWQLAVARLAAAEMPNRITACDTANRSLYRWQFDLARAAGANDEQYRISEADLDNPLGTRAGQVYAWKVVSEAMNLRGFAI